MIFIKKFSIISALIFLTSVHLGYPLKVSETEYSDEYSTEPSIDELNDYNSTLVDDYGDTAITEDTTQGITSSAAHIPISSPSSSQSSTISTTNKGDRTTAKPRPPWPRPSSTKPSSISTEYSSSTQVWSSTGSYNSSTTNAFPIPPPLRCNEDGSYDGQYEVEHWPPVDAGHISIVECPHEGSYASWLCLDSGIFEPNGPNWNNCSDWLDELEVDLETPMAGVQQVIQVIETISNKTVKNNTIVESEKLSKVLNIISKVQTLIDNANDTNLCQLEGYATNIVESFTHIMDQKYAWNNTTAIESTGLASKILIGTQSSSYTLSLQQNESTNMIEIHNNDFYINTFYTNFSSELIFPSNKDNYSSIIIPPNTMFVNTTIGRNNTALGAIIRNLDKHLSANMEEYHEINSDILSFSLTNSSERLELNKDVKIILKHRERLQLGDRVDCAFWDFNQSKWSSDGCHIDEEESDLLQTVCKCNHLTNFAALMDVRGREEATLLKSVLTYVCSLISIFGLIFTINLIIRSKNHSEKVTNKGSLSEMRSLITCNLCICLLITNVLVLAGMDRTDILWLCQLSSALLLYSLLSSFFWMLMEGYYLYKSLVLVFQRDFKPFYLYVVGYGVPIAILIVSLIIIYIKENILLEALFDKRYNYFCWISSSHYPSHIWILIAPAVCVIVCNCVLVFISFRTAFKILRNQSAFGMTAEKSKLKLKQIISFIFLLFLLGITWLSFLLYINQFFTNFFAYLFIVLNGSQGFFIFLYHLSIYDWRGGRRSNMSSNNSKF